MSNRHKKTLEDKMLRTMKASSIEYGIIEPGDRILVAVSGGKDSYVLLHLLNKLTRELPFKIDIVAVHVSQGQPGVDPAPLEKWLEESGIPFEIVDVDTFSVVVRNTKPGSTTCSVCSRMRRGVLYTTAERLKCNKIALGHHREDTLATFVMNLFYAGKLQAMPPKYTTDDGRFEVIRPMIEVTQEDIITVSNEQAFPIVPCGLCSAQEGHKRKVTEALLDDLERDNPRLKSVMLGALKHVKPTHLLDKTIMRKPK